MTVGVLRSLVDELVGCATHRRPARFGPFEVEVASDTEAGLAEIALHLASSGAVTWRPLSVATVTSGSVSRDELPAGLAPVDDHTAVAHADDITVFTAGHEGCTWFLDPVESRAVRWVDEIGDVPLWEQINPLRCAARWWSVEHDAAMTHCAAVGNADGAVLLVGDAGAGKSTTSLACLDHLDVLGDDFCFVEPRAGATSLVHPMYRIGKLDDRSLELLPHLRDRVLGSGMRGKSLIDMGNATMAARPVAAVCAVVQRPGETTRVVPMRRLEALQAVAPSTTMQIRLLQEATFQLLVKAMFHTPTYTLEVGDLAEVPAVLTDLITGRVS